MIYSETIARGSFLVIPKEETFFRTNSLMRSSTSSCDSPYLCIVPHVVVLSVAFSFKKTLFPKNVSVACS